MAADQTLALFHGPSRFGAKACTVLHASDGGEPTPAAAIDELREAFKGAIAARPGAKRCVVVGEVARALARLLLPHAELLSREAIGAGNAVGLAHWNTGSASLLLEVALDLVRNAGAGAPSEIPVARLQGLAPDRDVLPEQTLLRNAAHTEGIFAHRVDLSNGGALLVLGSGSRQRRLLGLLPDATTFAGALATNKNAACELLARHGLPVPRGERVTTREEAHAAAARLGFPVTLKVATGSRQRGVVPCVISPRALDRSFDLLARSELRLEQHVAGGYFRAFVANGELVACATANLPVVTGDGKHTILGLIARDHPWLQAMLASKDAALATNAREIVRHVLAGHERAPENVLPEGETVPVAFPTSEGHAYDVTAEVHPENRALLVRAARVLGMFWTGIDVQAERIDVPLREQEAAILEVNDVPAFAFHGVPLEGRGKGVDMARAIFKAFFGERRANVPVVLVVGESREKLAASVVLGLTKRNVRAVRATGPRIGLAAALDPEADAIVIAEDAGVLLERGLAVPGVDVVLVERGAKIEGGLAALVAGAREGARGVVVTGVARAIAEAVERSRA